MYPHPSPLHLVALATCLFMVGGPDRTAAQAKFFRWTDEDGAVHFSNTGPPKKDSKNVEERVMRPPPRPSLPPDNGEIRFVFLEGDTSRRYVPVVLEGKHRRRRVLMLLDTGAQMTLIDEDLADELHIDHVRDMRIAGVGGSVPGWLGKLRLLKLGDEEIRHSYVAVGPSRGLRLLGMDVINSLGFEISRTALRKKP